MICLKKRMLEFQILVMSSLKMSENQTYERTDAHQRTGGQPAAMTNDRQAKPRVNSEHPRRVLRFDVPCDLQRFVSPKTTLAPIYTRFPTPSEPPSTHGLNVLDSEIVVGDKCLAETILTAVPRPFGDQTTGGFGHADTATGRKPNCCTSSGNDTPRRRASAIR